MIESPKNFIEQFQNFIEHIAGVMKGFVKSINNVKPDANGNVTVDVGVKTVNSNGPDSNGNVVVAAGVTSVNGATGAITPNQTGCLPLSGGEMIGHIATRAQNILGSSVDDQCINIDGGASYNNGASLTLYGKSHTNKGMFQIHATDGSNASMLIGTATDRLTWNDHTVYQYLKPAIKTELATDGSVVTVPFDGLLMIKTHRANSGIGYVEIYLDNSSLGSVDTNNWSVGHREFPVMKGQTIQTIQHNVSNATLLLIGYK